MSEAWMLWAATIARSSWERDPGSSSGDAPKPTSVKLNGVAGRWQARLCLDARRQRPARRTSDQRHRWGTKALFEQERWRRLQERAKRGFGTVRWARTGPTPRIGSVPVCPRGLASPTSGRRSPHTSRLARSFSGQAPHGRWYRLQRNAVHSTRARKTPRSLNLRDEEPLRCRAYAHEPHPLPKPKQSTPTSGPA
jgi:hypothetical protein